MKIKKDLPSKYKTRNCDSYIQNNFCPYGLRCQFRHPLKTVSFMSGHVKSFVEELDEAADLTFGLIKQDFEGNLKFQTGKSFNRLSCFRDLCKQPDYLQKQIEEPKLKVEEESCNSLSSVLEPQIIKLHSSMPQDANQKFSNPLQQEYRSRSVNIGPSA